MSISTKKIEELTAEEIREILKDPNLNYTYRSILALELNYRIKRLKKKKND